MGKSLPLICALLLFAACGQKEFAYNDRLIRHLYGPVKEVLPVNAGERLRFDSTGHLTEIERLDASGTSCGVSSRYRYPRSDSGNHLRIETQLLHGKPYAIWNSTIVPQNEGFRIDYFEPDSATGKPIPTGVWAIYRFSDGLLASQVAWDGSETSYVYENDARLPCEEKVSRNGEIVLSIRYRYDQLDSLGNWLVRTTLKDHAEPFTERRQIIYFP